MRTARREGDEARAEQAAHESRALGEEEKKLTAEADALASELRGLLLTVANLPAADSPDGTSPADNVVLRVEGYDASRYTDQQRVPHWDIGAALGILDLERGAKLSGSMFPMFRSLLRRLGWWKSPTLSPAGYRCCRSRSLPISSGC